MGGGTHRIGPRNGAGGGSIGLFVSYGGDWGANRVEKWREVGYCATQW